MAGCVVDQHCLVYRRNYCNRPLRWHLVQDPCDPSKAPDVVFDDVTFNPLLGNPTTDLLQLLDTWDSSTDTLTTLLPLLLARYLQHQKDRIAALDDERLLFELAMLEDLGCTEVLLAAATDGTQQACFSIPVGVELAPADKLTAFLQDANSSGSSATQQHLQQQQQFVLHVAFKVGPGVSSHTAPDILLQSPPWATQYLPPFSLPSWDPQTSLVEYVPHVAERLSKHLQDHCPPAVVRFELVQALSTAFGQPLEVNMRSSAVRSTLTGGASSSSSTGALTAAAAAKGRCSSSAVFQIMFEQQPLLLYVEMGATFPTDAPALMVQSMRRLGPDSCHSLNNAPWSPRWAADEMAARLFNFVKQEVANLVRDTTGGSAGGAL